MIGGCGSINAMIYLRGHRLDFDGWAAERRHRAGRTTRCSRTSSASEDNERGEDAFHGVGGPLAVSESRSLQPLVDAMLEAAVQAGYEHIPDLNVERPEGVSRFQVNQRNGKRCSTADAYLHPASDRPNLEVRTGVFRSAHRLRGQPGRRRRGESGREGRDRAHAEREVILAAGAYQSPVLLMLSGIGPEEDLALFGLPCARTCRSAATSRTTAW